MNIFPQILQPYFRSFLELKSPHSLSLYRKEQWHSAKYLLSFFTEEIHMGFINNRWQNFLFCSNYPFRCVCSVLPSELCVRVEGSLWSYVTLSWLYDRWLNPTLLPPVTTVYLPPSANCVDERVCVFVRERERDREVRVCSLPLSDWQVWDDSPLHWARYRDPVESVCER